jgi:isopenicillin-N N-acyltransferase like protein
MDFPLIDLRGTPHERGRAHGSAVPERVARSIALYRGELERRGVAVAEIHRLAREFAPHVGAFDAAYLEEMQGIADGAGVALEDIVLVNCRTEMMFGARAMLEKDKNDGCTAAIILPEAAEGGTLIHGHNWDWREQCVDTGVVLRIRRSDGPDILAFAEAGALARHGMNSAGVSLTGNYISCERDFKTGGRTPLGLVRRKLLESPNLAAALRTAWGHQRACSTNVMLAAAQGEAIDLEMAPDEIFPVAPRDGILVHANHWTSPAAQAKLRDTGIAISVCTLYRQRRTDDALRAKRRPISVADVKEVLADEYGKPDSVLRPPKPGIVGSVTCTVCTTIMLPAKGEMWIARKPWVERNFKRYSLAA